jgi:hypothetical protein
MNEPFEYIDSDGRTILAERHDAPSNLQGIDGAICYDGVPLRDVAPEFKNDPTTDLRYTQAYSERNAVRFLLAAAGYREFNLHSQTPPTPDVRAEFSDGSVAHVETAEVIESAPFIGVLQFINVGIRRAFQQEPSLEAKLKGYYLEIRAWMTQNGTYDRDGVVEEFLGFLRKSDFSALPARQIVDFDGSYPKLKTISASYYCCPCKTTTIPQFEPAAHSFAPQSLANQVLRVLARKRSLGPGYLGSPLWLALYMSDQLGVPKLSLDDLDGAKLDFSPFVKLLIGDQGNVIVYSVK